MCCYVTSRRLYSCLRKAQDQDRFKVALKDCSFDRILLMCLDYIYPTLLIRRLHEHLPLLRADSHY